MCDQELFAEAVRSAGDVAGVFEHDGETGYFYLYALDGPTGARILGSIHVVTGVMRVASSDVTVRWSHDEARVGLFVGGRLWAVFADETGYGGNYTADAEPCIPAHLLSGFDQS